MLHHRHLFILATSLSLSLAACKKESYNEPSGALKDSEKELFGYLSGDANIAFGGEYKDFMDYWDNSPLKDMSKTISKLDPDGADLSEYMNCWVEHGRDSKLAGTGVLKGGSFEVDMVFSGLGADALKKCAKQTKLDVIEAPDGKFIEIKGLPDGLGGKSSSNYYFPTPKIVFFSMRIPLGLLGGAPKSPSRSELEAKVAANQKNSATGSDKVKKLTSMADRSKDFWFAGSAEGTPAAAAVKTGTAWFDTEKDALTFGFSVDLTDKSMAESAVKAFNEMDGQLGMLPGDLQDAVKDFLKSAKLKNNGGTLTGKFIVKNSLMEKFGPFLKQMVP